jgi:hypothetical protein
MTFATLVALQKAEPLLTKRLGQLQERLQAGEEAAWGEFIEVVKVLAALVPTLSPESRGAMLTTKDMAARLGISPKTLLRHKNDKKIQPAVAKGKLLRWSGQENLR